METDGVNETDTEALERAARMTVHLTVDGVRAGAEGHAFTERLPRDTAFNV